MSIIVEDIKEDTENQIKLSSIDLYSIHSEHELENYANDEKSKKSYVSIMIIVVTNISHIICIVMDSILITNKSCLWTDQLEDITLGAYFVTDLVLCSISYTTFALSFAFNFQSNSEKAVKCFYNVSNIIISIIIINCINP